MSDPTTPILHVFIKGEAAHEVEAAPIQTQKGLLDWARMLFKDQEITTVTAYYGYDDEDHKWTDARVFKCESNPPVRTAAASGRST